jgi:hypothetical protein
MRIRQESSVAYFIIPSLNLHANTKIQNGYDGHPVKILPGYNDNTKYSTASLIRNNWDSGIFGLVNFRINRGSQNTRRSRRGGGGVEIPARSRGTFCR